MAGTSRKAKQRVFEVLVSFDGLNKGERFSQEPDDLGWALQRVESGYLQDVTDESGPQEVSDERSEAGQS